MAKISMEMECHEVVFFFLYLYLSLSSSKLSKVFACVLGVLCLMNGGGFLLASMQHLALGFSNKTFVAAAGLSPHFLILPLGLKCEIGRAHV